MLLTETNARKTRCPTETGGEYVMVETANRNRTQWPHGHGRYCIASGCMAWRWADTGRRIAWTSPIEWHAKDDPPSADAFAPPDGEGWEARPDTITYVDDAPDDGWAMAWRRTAQLDRRGYCGIAGMP